MCDRLRITEVHRRRRAVVYVRQSTPAQLERNHESRARRYALRDRAVELGGPAGSVVVVDEDLGRSGASTDGRLGFKELVAEVGRGQVGLVLALEVSRFARSSADWHQLLDLCALTGTLIADSDGIYSPADFNDRLLLGLKGTMSEAEPHLIRSRLDGLRNKATRGELEQNLPVGLDRDEDGRIVLSADEQVRHAIDRVFLLWRRLGVRAPGRPGADRRASQAAAADGWFTAGALDARELWRRPRLPDQPGLCRRVRVRPHPPAETA
jgi:DNA invertase Pin-like site-specific DNA recombinase